MILKFSPLSFYYFFNKLKSENEFRYISKNLGPETYFERKKKLNNQKNVIRTDEGPTFSSAKGKPVMAEHKDDFTNTFPFFKEWLYTF